MMADICTGSFCPKSFQKFKDYYVNLIIQHAQFIGNWWRKKTKKNSKDFAGENLFIGTSLEYMHSVVLVGSGFQHRRKPYYLHLSAN